MWLRVALVKCMCAVCSPHEFKVCAMRAEKVAAGAQIEIGRHRALNERVSWVSRVFSLARSLWADSAVWKLLQGLCNVFITFWLPCGYLEFASADFQRGNNAVFMVSFEMLSGLNKWGMQIAPFRIWLYTRKQQFNCAAPNVNIIHGKESEVFVLLDEFMKLFLRSR
jgi:hypothetical protein